jgi:hypothetical protein
VAIFFSIPGQDIVAGAHPETFLGRSLVCLTSGLAQMGLRRCLVLLKRTLVEELWFLVIVAPSLLSAKLLGIENRAPVAHSSLKVA